MNKTEKVSKVRAAIWNARYAVIGSLFISLNMTFSSYEKCLLCKGDYRIPALSELDLIHGEYVIVKKGRSIDLGAIKIKGANQPVVCGYARPNLEGQPAQALFDKSGNIFVLYTFVKPRIDLRSSGTN